MQKSFSFRVIMLAALLLMAQGFVVYALGDQESGSAVPVKGKIILSTTTSTQDSGLLNYLLPVFTRETGWQVDVISVGTGAALQMGRDGNADVLLVHAKADEIKFVADGWGVRRYDVMYNDFLIVGPDLKAIRHNGNIIQTLKDIAAGNLPFVSRGDDSGTHRMENNLWRAAGIDPKTLSRYTSTGQGMGATLQMAYELRAYTLTDRATWLTLTKNKSINLPAVCEKAEDLLNYYGVIAVNPAKYPKVNAEGAQAFVEWMIKPSSQKLIGQFGIKEFGKPLFTPNAIANR